MPYRESSALCHCLSENHGKITIIASGCNKETSRFTGLLEPFNLLNLELNRSPKSEIFNLNNAGIVRGYLNNVNYQTNLLIHAAAELLMQIDFTEEEGEEFFYLLDSYCAYLHNSKYHPFLVFLRFTLRLFSLLGIPLNTSCSSCNKPEVSYFTTYNNGFLCLNCYSQTTSKTGFTENCSGSYQRVAEDREDYSGSTVPLSSETTEILRNIYRMDGIDRQLVTSPFIDDIKKIILMHFNSSFHKLFNLKSLKDYHV